MCYDQNRKLTNRERIIGMIGCNNIETFNRWKEIEIMRNIENKVKNYSNDDLLVTYDKEYLKLLAEQDKKEALKKSEINGNL